MDVRTTADKLAPSVASPPEVVAQLAAQLQAQQAQWLLRLAEQPHAFADLEVAVHQAFDHMADQLVASLLAKATAQSPALDEQKKSSR